MKKTVIISTQPIKNFSTNISAFVKIIKLISEHDTNVEVVSQDYEMYRKDVDNIVIAYGTFYCDFKNLMTFLEKNKDKRFFYLVNEYALVPNGDVYRFLIKHDYEVIASYMSNAQGAKHFSKFHSLNLNVTGFTNINILPFEKRHKGLVYWGRFRPDRKKYFDKYFDGIDLSTADKNTKLFSEYNVNFIEPVQFTEESVLQRYKYSIYIEDEYSHTNYTYPASRFYEAISIGLIMFFDESCRNTFKLANYPIEDFYFVSSRKEIDEKIRIIEKNPDKYLEHSKNLRDLVSKEYDSLFKDISKVFQKDKEKSDLLCPNCGANCSLIFDCHNCQKKVCSKCLVIYKKHYCSYCASSLKLIREKNEIALF